MGCITLLSDFGLQDASVASVKGIIMQQSPTAKVVDITHMVEPRNLQQAAYLLAASYRHFPAGTCHILLCDIFYEKAPLLLLHQRDGQFFLAPDNGVLSLAFGDNPGNVWRCFELQAEESFSDWVRKTVNIAMRLSNSSAQALGFEASEMKNAPVHCLAKIEDNAIEGQVIHIDRYRNVVVNITQQEFDTVGKGRPFRIEFMREEAITELGGHYRNVRHGDKLCRFNSIGYLEIAVNRGPAAELFSMKMKSEKDFLYNIIKISFE
jgi:S-adenosylmethionine hydrolase